MSYWFYQFPTPGLHVEQRSCLRFVTVNKLQTVKLPCWRWKTPKIYCLAAHGYSYLRGKPCIPTLEWDLIHQSCVACCNLADLLDTVAIKLDCEQSLSLPSVWRAIEFLSLICMSWFVFDKQLNLKSWWNINCL